MVEELDCFFERDCRQRILIDVPIGLPSGRFERQCDKEARKCIGSRRSSVFRVPVRNVLSAHDYEEARRLSEAETGKSISKTAWSIVPKIRQVDRLLRALLLRNRNHDVLQVVREIHPEVCFWAFNGEKELRFGKKTHNGFWTRLNILDGVCKGIETEIRAMCTDFNVAPDDVLDATAAALTATFADDRLAYLPKQPSTRSDDCGLPMRIVYAHRLPNPECAPQRSVHAHRSVSRESGGLGR